jgi:hypothetical protein
MLIINGTHESRRRREYLVDEDEDGLLRCQLDTLPYHVDELAYGEILVAVNIGQFNQRHTQHSLMGQGTSSCRS